MSFLKISYPVKRDLIVKEYLELKKNIRDNLLSERTGEQQLQTDLSKFYRPITETQLWKLIMLKSPYDYNDEDEYNYKRLMVKTNALHHINNPKNPHPKSSRSTKWVGILSEIWENRKKYEGEGVVVISSDPNALLEILDLLLASQEVGHTGVRNELVSICDELKRQGVLDRRLIKN